MTRFVIDLGGIDMPQEMQEDLNSELQKVALSYVADLRLDRPLAFKFPRPFPWGIIIGPEFNDVLRIEERLTGALKEIG